MRNLYPISNQRTLDRKIKEACLAIKLSDKWSKPRILDEYLNAVYYGNHAYGVKAAAQTYFNETPRYLTRPQAALIAGMTQAPSDYDPFVHPDAALDRRNEVLRAMLDNGDLTRRQYREAVQSPLGLRDGRGKLRHPATSAARPLLLQLRLRRAGRAVRRRARCATGGLKVYTTVDRGLQRQAANVDPRAAEPRAPTRPRPSSRSTRRTARSRP